MVNYMESMVTSIQLSEALRDELKRRKLHAAESYEEVIWSLIEDTEELSAEAKRGIAEAEADLKHGRVHTLNEVRRELGMK